MNELVIIIVVIAFLSIVLTFLLTFIVKKTNALVKSIYVDRMSEFDFLLDDKEKKVNELNDDIKKKQELITQLEEKSKEYSNNSNEKKDEVVMPKFVGFEDTSTFNNYRVIKEKFSYDPTDVIKDFVLKNSNSDNKDYQVLTEIRSYFTFDVIYKIGQYQKEEQYEIITSLLNNNELSKVKEYLNKDKFDLKKFIEELDNLITKSDPKIMVLVGNKDSNYDYLDKNITTSYDSKITEGFKIIYKGVIYDYSI